MLVPLHAAPHHAVAEIDALYDVYLDVIDKWGTDVSPAPTQSWVRQTHPGGGHRGVDSLGWLRSGYSAGHAVPGRLQR